MMRIAFVLILLVAPIFAGHTLTAEQQKGVSGWLAKHPQYRVATDSDCDCKSMIAAKRSGEGDPKAAVPDYHPYVATGDFNRDGKEDFAVVIFDNVTKKNALVVFNGPNLDVPAFIESGLDLKQKGLYYGPPASKPYYLLLGDFYSDDLMILKASGKTYVIK